MAYEFAVALKLDHRFNNDKTIAGYDWLWSFLRRHPNLSIRKSEGLSMARGMGLTREAAQTFYDLLEKEINDYKLQDKPQNIFNVDESGIQLINKVGEVVAKKGAKVVQKLTTGEKGETVTLVCCASAEGRFLPPAIIFKGKNLKPEFKDGLPPGSSVYMNPKSGYINSDLFLKWFKEEFIPRKATGRNILVLDGHYSHCSSIALLQAADEHGISLLCLPPHTTHALQPLDKSFFAPFKAFFKVESNTWVEQHVGRKLTRYQVGPLICKAWNKSATVGNGTSGFRSTGIFPFNRNIIPEHFFSISDNMDLETDVLQQPINQQIIPRNQGEPPNKRSKLPFNQQPSRQNCPQPSTSKGISNSQSTQETPSKYLHNISPVPLLRQGKRSKKGAVMLTSPTNIRLIKEKVHNRQERDNKNQLGLHTAELKKRRLNFDFGETNSDCADDLQSTNDRPKTTKRGKKSFEKNMNVKNCDLTFHSSDINKCKECLENYFQTTKKGDWLRCANCKRWLHEECTIFHEFCIDCGRVNRLKDK